MTGKMLDSSIIRTHQHVAKAKGGRKHQALGCSRGGFSKKIHAVVDVLGCPADIKLTDG